jgi:transposase
MKKDYSEEFKKESVRVFECSGVSKSQVARELGINHHTFYGWVEKYGAKREKCDVGEDLASENKRLRRELKRAELERDILKKAVSIFSKELP